MGEIVLSAFVGNNYLAMFGCEVLRKRTSQFQNEMLVFKKQTI